MFLNKNKDISEVKKTVNIFGQHVRIQDWVIRTQVSLKMNVFAKIVAVYTHSQNRSY
jgi:P2-related tail formation protein